MTVPPEHRSAAVFFLYCSSSCSSCWSPAAGVAVGGEEYIGVARGSGEVGEAVAALVAVGEGSVVLVAVVVLVAAVPGEDSDA
jgi:hypothetical protein